MLQPKRDRKRLAFVGLILDQISFQNNMKLPSRSKIDFESNGFYMHKGMNLQRPDIRSHGEVKVDPNGSSLSRDVEGSPSS